MKLTLKSVVRRSHERVVINPMLPLDMYSSWDVYQSALSFDVVSWRSVYGR